MGTAVLDAGSIQQGFHAYAHCLKGRAGGVTVLAINTSHTEAHSLQIEAPSDRYTLSAVKPDATEIRLNGEVLNVQRGELPELRPERRASGPMKFDPLTITFVAIPDAGNRSCQ